MSTRIEKIGNATLYLADCRDVLPTLPKVDAVITDPPYSERTHAGHDTVTNTGRAALGYGALTLADVAELAPLLHSAADGWVVWMSDHVLAPAISEALRERGRYVFAPLPFFQSGRSVRITGDGPCSWTDWIVVARTAAQVKWGTLPGGYVAGCGWSDKARMGGKPTQLMNRLVSDYSRPAQTVLDPFMGAGTTGVACAGLARDFIGCEIDPECFDIACRRIEDAQRQGRLIA